MVVTVFDFAFLTCTTPDIKFVQVCTSASANNSFLHCCCRVWKPAFMGITLPAAVALRIKLMLDWIDGFIRASRSMQKRVQKIEDLDLAASIFFGRLEEILPATNIMLKAVMSQLSAEACVRQLQRSQTSPAGQGKLSSLQMAAGYCHMCATPSGKRQPHENTEVSLFHCRLCLSILSAAV